MASVTDKFLKLDTTANTTAGALVEGIAKSAQNAKLAGFNIDQLSASIAALKDTTGNTETQVANSLNMIFSRLQNVKLGKYVIELEDGDTEDITEALNDVEKILNTVNIKLRDSKGEFRDIGELFTELSENWGKFNSVQQSAIANTVAGARQRNTFIALIENWNKVQELTDVSLNSAGTAVQKYEAYLDSIEAKTAGLNTSMKELWNDLLPNELMGNLLEAGTAIVQFVDKLQILKTALTGVVVWGAANGFLAAAQGLDGIITSLTNMSAAMRLASKGAALTNAEFDTLKKISNGLTDSQLKLLLSVEGLTEEQIKQLISTEGLTEAELQQRLATLGLAQVETTTTTATFSLSGALETLWVTIAANPIMTLTMLITGAIVAFDYIQRKEAEARDAAVDSANAYKEQAKSLAELRQKYIDIIDNEMTDSEKTEELNKWKQTLIETYGLEKSALENINLEREKGLGLLDEEIAKQNRNARNKWFDENEKAINKSQQKMGYSGQDYFQIPDGKDVADSILWKDWRITGNTLRL